MKKAFLILSAFCILTAIASAGWLAWAIHGAGREGPLPETKIILIERGTGVTAIARQLEQEGVIDSALLFKILNRIDADTRPLKAGEYEFTARISMAGALEMMRAGKTYDRKVTFPEGMTSWQMVEILKGRTDLSGTIESVPPEGSLLPHTYHYIRDKDRAEIIAEMGAAMTKTIDELWEGRAADLPIATKEEAITLASIVEKETGVAEERARVAGVFINRLRIGMLLQSDPTVIYAITQGKVEDEGLGPLGRRLLRKDLETQSPYNTYLNKGLPPGPIANPGRDSIAATLNPERHEYFYFVADGTGGHVFARTLAEHNRNVARWRQIRNAP
jgi:UPF0755 protein